MLPTQTQHTNIYKTTNKVTCLDSVPGCQIPCYRHSSPSEIQHLPIVFHRRTVWRSITVLEDRSVQLLSLSCKPVALWSFLGVFDIISAFSMVLFLMQLWQHILAWELPVLCKCCVVLDHLLSPGLDNIGIRDIKVMDLKRRCNCNQFAKHLLGTDTSRSK